VDNQSGINNNKSTIRLPLIIGGTLAAGIFIGASFFGSKKIVAGDVSKSSGIFKEILMYVDRSYVDKVNTDSLANYGIAKMLEKLDPHTVYLPLEDAKVAREQLQDGFDGIGVEFNIYNDSLFVVTALSGGPSETVGIQGGDVILSANNVQLLGKKLDNNLVFKTLRGPRGSAVLLKIRRKGVKTPLNFTVKRDKIPTFSVDAAFLMTDKKTGYLKVNRFSEATYKEFRTHLKDLISQGMTRLILDLRGNPGGYMDRATDMADELIAGKDVLVYTDGKDNSSDQKIYAGKDGLFEKGEIVVLVDEGSASAAEIVSGALQDYDRASIVGRRTFGKGLVQAPIQLSDGSELRLTISRYYIPSGRSIQKPYVAGNLDEYYEEVGHRNMALKKDTVAAIKTPKKKFKTKGGRVVYDGGGITPDVVVNRDTTYYTTYLFDLYGKNIIREYALTYAAQHKDELSKRSIENYLTTFSLSDAELVEVNKMATKAGVKFNQVEFQRSKPFLKNQLKALIARSVWQKSSKKGLSNEFYQVTNQDDEMIKVALQQFGKALKK
jgi:carboxyl-terminal processing protease